MIYPPFPQRLKNKAKDTEFQKFLSIFNSLSINVPLFEAITKIPRYAKFMKEFVFQKITLEHEELKCLIIAVQS